MKKILLSLFLLLSISSFSFWESIELTDEFGDKTGEMAMINQINYNQFLRLDKSGNNVDLVVKTGIKLIDGETYPIKMKVDGGKIIQVFGVPLTDKVMLLTITNDIMEKIKKGNKLAIMAYDPYGGTVKLVADLNGFKAAYDKIKQSKN